MVGCPEVSILNIKERKIMKKYVFHPAFSGWKGSQKALLCMKLSFILVLAACLQVSAKGYSQNDVSLSLHLNNVKLSKAFTVIERKTKCRFLYSDDIVPVNKRIYMVTDNTPLPEILNALLKETDLHFKVLDNNVIVIAKKGVVIANKKISGIVTDNKGDPLIGVTVQVKGTGNGTVTDANGKFSMDVPDNATLVISSVGFDSKEVIVDGQSDFTISLQPSSSTLNELVVTGYSTTVKKNITGSISSIKGSDLVSIPAGNADKQLQGKVSGVTITTSGEPGGASSVRIRGYGSFTSNNPLYVVDGVQTTDISSIDPNDIATISVLKDAASASIYGARAFAGVILITTKKGTPGKFKVNYNVSYGRQYPGHGFDLMTPQQTAEWTWKAMQNAGETPSHPQYGTGAQPVLPDYILAGSNYGLKSGDPKVDPSLYNIDPTKGAVYQIVKANKAGTNWYDAVTRVAPIQSHSLSLSGGTDNAVYNIQMGYYNQQGVVLETYLKRYTIRANTEFTIHNRVKIGENIQMSLKDNPTIGNGDVGGNEGNAIGWSYRENPLIPVHDIMGNYAGTAAAGFNNPQNPVADQERTRNNRSYTTDFFGNVYADVLLPYNLTLHSSFGGDYYNGYYNTYGYKQYENKENNPTTDYVYEGASYGYGWIWTNTLQFEQQFGKSYLKVLLGEEAKGGLDRNVDGHGTGPFSTDPNYTTINTTQSNGRVITDGGGPRPTYYSLFAQVNYNYEEKYLLSGTIRRDGASVFGPQKKYGIFPAVSAGWRISGENFMKDVTWINDLKLRGSYGEMGNADPVPLTNQYNTYATSPQAASYDINGTDNSLEEGIRPNSIGVPFTHWETNKTLDFGVDATLFNNSFTVTVDWYKRNTEGLLYNPQVEATVGFLTSYPYINVGSMQNTGVDLQLDKKGTFATNWHYDIGLTFSTYKNKITKVASGVKYFYGNSYGSGRIGSFTINEDGYPISSFYGYKVIGLWQSQAEIDAADAAVQKATGDLTATYQPGGENPGEFKYADVDTSGSIDANDRTVFGNPNPDFTYGINANIGFKNFDLTLYFYGVWGGNLINYTKWYTDFYSSFPGQAISTRVFNSWTPQHTNTNIPIFEDVSTASTNLYANSYYMENASYFRCRNIQLGYTFPKGLLQRGGIENLRIYVQAINLFTVTKYDGLDPAISGIDGNMGVDYGSYPFVKQFLVGANVTF
jgi:TonB-linked SusC/RagA family outer membrane protein